MRKAVILTLLLAAVSFSLGCRQPDGTLTLHVLSVGHGDAILIELSNGKNLMIDTGPKKSQKSLIRYLRALNISSLDAILITHPHDNHYGGLPALARVFPIYQLLTNEDDSQKPSDYFEMIRTLEENGAKRIKLKKGKQVKLDPSVSITILNPKSLSGEPNADSLVTRLIFGKTSFLLSADITPAVQKQLVKEWHRTKKPDFVLLPHHGDKVDPLFSDLVTNSIKVISTGPSKWLTPDPDTVKQFPKNLYRTDLNGHLTFRSDGSKVEWIPSS